MLPWEKNSNYKERKKEFFEKHETYSKKIIKEQKICHLLCNYIIEIENQKKKKLQRWLVLGIDVYYTFGRLSGIIKTLWVLCNWWQNPPKPYPHNYLLKMTTMLELFSLFLFLYFSLPPSPLPPKSIYLIMYWIELKKCVWLHLNITLQLSTTLAHNIWCWGHNNLLNFQRLF